MLFVCNAIGQGTAQKTAPTFQDFLKGCGYSPLQLESDNGHLIIPGKIGTKKCRFLVDTGCTITVLGPELATGLKSLKELNVEYDDPLIRKINPAQIVLIPVLKFSSGEFRNQPAQIHTTEFDYVPTLEKAILGTDFLLRNHALIDYLNAKLWVRATEPPASVKTVLADTLKSHGFADASLEFDFEPGISCNSVIDGHECKLAVDTGAVWTILDRQRVKQWGLNVLYRTTEINIIGVGNIGSHEVHELQVRRFQLGTLSVTNAYVGVTDMSAWGISSSQVSGLVGAEMLVTHGALIDYSNRTLWLQRRESKFSR